MSTVRAHAMPLGDRAFFGHPRGLSTLFFTEMWERFSYYGMRALLILFMTAPIASGGLGFDTGVAGAVYGLYTSMVYMTNLPGGWIADRLIGQRRAVLYGGILIACGHFSLAFPALATFYLGLILVVAFASGVYTGTVPVSAKQIADAAGYFLLATVVLFFAWLFFIGDWTPAERKRLYAIGAFFVAAALFWSQFEQAGSTLNLFGDRATRTSIFGWEFPSSYY